MTQFYYEKDVNRAANDYPKLAALQDLHPGTGVRAMEHDLMRRLGPGAKAQH